MLEEMAWEAPPLIPGCLRGDEGGRYAQVVALEKKRGKGVVRQLLGALNDPVWYIRARGRAQ